MGQISDKLKAAIKQDGRPLTVIAQDSGVSAPQLTRFVNGERGLNIDTIERLAKFFGLKLQ